MTARLYWSSSERALLLEHFRGRIAAVGFPSDLPSDSRQQVRQPEVRQQQPFAIQQQRECGLQRQVRQPCRDSANSSNALAALAR